MRSAIILLLTVSFTAACYAQTRTVEVTLQDGTSRTGRLLDNFPPVYATIEDTSGWDHLIDYSMLATPSAESLTDAQSTRYSPSSMPEIKDLSVSTQQYSALDIVHFKDGKRIAGITERPRLERYLILRWPSGEEWLCYYDDIDSVTSMPLDNPIDFQEYRHYYAGVAGTLSLLVPGLGHVYNGNYVKAIGHAGLFVGTVGALVLATNSGAMGLELGGYLFMVSTIFAAHLYDVIDAGMSAHKREMRRKMWQMNRCSMRPHKKQVSMSFGLTPLPDGAAAGVGVRF